MRHNGVPLQLAGSRATNTPDNESAKVQTHSAKTFVFGCLSPNGSTFWPQQHSRPRPHRHQSGGIALHERPTRRRHAASWLRVVQNPHRIRTTPIGLDNSRINKLSTTCAPPDPNREHPNGCTLHTRIGCADADRLSPRG